MTRAAPRVPAAEIAAQLRNKAMVSLLVENELGVLEHGTPSFRSRKATG